MRPLLLATIAILILPAHRATAQENAAPIHGAIAAFNTDVVVSFDNPQSPAPRHVAFEYSEGYRTRAKIHKYAAFATLPLFATEVWLGQSTYDNPSEGKKGAHIAIGSSIIALYGVQAVTGVWNLVEANKDPVKRKRRTLHSILMLASGAGFAITPMVAPGEGESRESGSANTHRTVALTSIAVGTAGYLIMLFGGK
jgi:hypothetical protein